jgi:hypothetical protein
LTKISTSALCTAPAVKPSLAVLPFQNMTGDPEQDYFVDGIVEEITFSCRHFWDCLPRPFLAKNQGSKRLIPRPSRLPFSGIFLA